MNIVAFVISLGLFVGGIVLMGYSFEGAAAPGLMFFSGIIATSVGIGIPFHVLKRIDG